MSPDELTEHRYQKFRKIGAFSEAKASKQR